MRKTVAVDASFLNVFLDKHAHSSIQNGPALVANLINNLDGERAKVIIPTPALAQVLTHHPRAGQAYVEHIRQCACFQIRPFDDKAAFELAQLLRENVTKNILKFDRSKIMVQSWSTNRCQPLLNTLLGATRVAYFQSVTC